MTGREVSVPRVLRALRVRALTEEAWRTVDYRCLAWCSGADAAARVPGGVVVPGAWWYRDMVRCLVHHRGMGPAPS